MELVMCRRVEGCIQGLLELHRVVPLVPLYTNTTLQPTEFLHLRLPTSTLALVAAPKDRLAG
jgi:hypothetical protein